MRIGIIQTIVLFFVYCCSLAQVKPVENRLLNYRLIGFSVPPLPGVVGYTLEIAKGFYFTEDSFRKNIITTQASQSGNIISEVPWFGCKYTWRVVYQFPEKKLSCSPLSHFETGIIKKVDTTQYRLRITKPAAKFSDAYVFLDHAGVLYDMNGKPVWYLPEIEGRSLAPSDLKLSPFGTITFVDHDAYEINYDGEILWKAPNDGIVSGEANEHYHHDFTRLRNGHYMVLGMEQFSRRNKNKGTGHTTVPEHQQDDTLTGTIIEYNQKGNIVWYWKSSKYFLESGLMNKASGDIKWDDIHENAFFFDDIEKVIYLSCKGINTILKIKYPEGNVIGSYGDVPLPGAAKKGKRLFCSQHSVGHSQKGCMFLYNNNDCNNDQLPKIKMIREPRSGEQFPEIIWEYLCGTDSVGTKKFASGGNVCELPGRSFFACLGGEYSKVFIVDYDKTVVWSALPEFKADGIWVNNHQYRAGIIDSRKKLETLLFRRSKKYMAAKRSIVQ